MPLASPKVATTRLSIPIGISGEEPANAQVGTLGYATDTDKVRVRTSTGWQDVGGGGAGSITSIDSPDGSLDITNPGGPVVSIEVDPANVTVAGQATGPLTATKVVGITETSGPTALAIGAINNFQLLQRVGATVVGTAYPPTTLAGDANGSMTANEVNAIHETSGPTQLTIGAVAAGTSLTRSGSTLVGVSKVNSDFGTYSAKGSPGPLDSLVINDAAAGGAVKFTFLQDIMSSTNRSRGGLFRSPPAGTAHAQSDEFTSGSSDLATRGWTCINAATGATMTRVGDISNTVAASSLSATQYRSTITPDGVCIQCSNNMFVYKTAVAPYRLVTAGGLSASPNTAPFEIRPNVVANTTVPLWGSAPGQQNCYVHILSSGGVYSCRARWQNGISDNANGWAINDVNLDTFQQGVSNIGAGVATAPYAAWSHLDRWVQGAAGSVASAGMPRFGFACVTNTAVDNYTPFAFMRYVRVYSMTASPPLL